MNNPIKVKPIQHDLLYTKIADAIMEYIKENDLKTGAGYLQNASLRRNLIQAVIL